MAREIEIKLRCPDFDALRRMLRELQAQPAGVVLEYNRLFDTPDGQLRRAGCGLRVRELRSTDDDTTAPHPAAVLTYKGPRDPGEIKSRDEYETTVSDATTLITILNHLGYREIVVYEKRRESWHLHPCEVTLDELPRLGTFMEIEGPSEQTLTAARAQLGLADTPICRESYVELTARHGDLDASGCRRLVFANA